MCISLGRLFYSHIVSLLMQELCAATAHSTFHNPQPPTKNKQRTPQTQGHRINPCNSLLHPAAEAGIAPEGDELCVQDAYTPHSTCWGCGPSAEGGLRLRSFRVRNGLEARISLGDEYCAFPGAHACTCFITRLLLHVVLYDAFWLL
jgi:hypothetical protein